MLIFEVDRNFKNVHKRGKFVDLEKGHENEKSAPYLGKFVWLDLKNAPQNQKCARVINKEYT